MSKTASYYSMYANGVECDEVYDTHSEAQAFAAVMIAAGKTVEIKKVEWEVPSIDEILGSDVQARADYEAWRASLEEDADDLEYTEYDADDQRLEETWAELQDFEW